MSPNSHFNHLLNEDVKSFIQEHEKEDEKKLLLQHKNILGVSATEIAAQISGRRKAKTKLPTFYANENVIYPPSINLEQCSSEATASFKANLFSGILALDLTGGFGIDSFFLSSRFEKVTYVEPDEQLLHIAEHNHIALGQTNLIYSCANAELFLKSADGNFDLVYIDPSRRTAASKKVFRFAECSPNVVELLPTLLKKAKNILIKASPLIDIQQGIRELGSVAKVIVVGVDNECKEVLFHITNDKAEPIIEAVDLSDGKPKSFSFTLIEERQATVTFSEPLQYLYEPTATILKSGAFKLMANRYDLKKLAPNTHLYTADQLINEFPGRIFNIENFLKSDPKSIKDVLQSGYANIFTRNYPLTPAQLKKKLKTQDGGEKFIIGFSGERKKYLVLASRIK